MPYTYADAHRNVLRSNVFSDKQKETLRRFDEWLQLNRDIKIATRYTYMVRMKTYVATFLGDKKFEDLTTRDVQKYLLQRPSSTSSIDTAAFKIFAKFLQREDLYTCFKSKKHNQNEPEILTEEEIEKIVNVCKTPYEKAVITLLADSGCRVGELVGLKVKDLLWDQHGCRMRIRESKTIPRTIRLYSSVPALQTFLNHHPKRDELDAWVFHGRNPDNPTVTVSIRKMLDRLAKRAGLKKHVHPHIFRHTAATMLAEQRMTARELMKRFGWNNFSTALRYTQKFDMAKVDNHYLEIMGKKPVEQIEKKPKVSVVLCVRCGVENDGGNEFCGRCGLVLDREKALQIEKRERRAERALQLLSNPKVWQFLERKRDE